MNLIEHLAANRARLATPNTRAGWQARAEALAKECAELRTRLAEIDYCMCGSLMKDHSIGSGHSPVSEHDYRFNQLSKRVEVAEKHAAQDAKERDEAREQKLAQQVRAEAAEARAAKAEKALHELLEPISDAGHTTADGLRHEIEQLRARVKELQALLDHHSEGEEAHREMLDYGK